MRGLPRGARAVVVVGEHVVVVHVHPGQDGGPGGTTHGSGGVGVPELGATLTEQAQGSGHEIEGTEFNVLIIGEDEDDVGFAFAGLPDDVVYGRVLGQDALDDATLLDPTAAIVWRADPPVGRPPVLTLAVVMTPSLVVASSTRLEISVQGGQLVAGIPSRSCCVAYAVKYYNKTN